MSGQRTGHASASTLRVVVVVGTDHHPFDRLVGWINGWLRQHPAQAAGFFVQSGTAVVTPACPWSPFLGVDQLDALLDRTDLIVCHGGPESIANAWARGQVPIVVPRLHQLGEHVDDHQLDFCRKIAGQGRVRLAETQPALAGLLRDAAHDIGGFRAAAPQAAAEEVVARFGALVEELVSQPRRRRRLTRHPRRPLTTGRGPFAAARHPSPGGSRRCSRSPP